MSLERVAGERERWLYVVELTEPLHLSKDAVVGSVFPSVVRVVVLMDGRVPTARVVPWPVQR